MTNEDGTPCGVCGELQRTDVAVVCSACAGSLRGTLRGVPTLLGYLRDVTARRARLGARPWPSGPLEPDEGRLLPLTAAEVPAPADLGALEAARDIRHAVMWPVRELTSPLQPLYGAAALDWLLVHLPDLRRQAWAPSAYADIRRAAGRGWALVDRPEGLEWLVGECGAVHESTGGEACTRRLYARIDEATVRCRCGARHDVAERRAHLLEQAREVRMTAQQAAAVLTTLGDPITPERIRQWKARGHLAVAGFTVEGRPRYRLGDVLDRLKAERFGVVDRIDGKAGSPRAS